DEYIYTNRNINIAEIRKIREKQYREKATGSNPNSKFSPGALVDLEYDVQILQVLYGSEIPELKTPRIRQALNALAEFGVLTDREKQSLTGAYYFLRRLINGLRMLRGNAKDLFLPPIGSDEFLHLARRIGYKRKEGLEPEDQLYMEFATRTAAVRTFVEKHFGRTSLPGHDTGNVADLVLSEKNQHELHIKILSKLGFKNTRRAYINIKEMAEKGHGREQFAMLAVLAFDILSRKPDPDMALNNWERFIKSTGSPGRQYQRLLSQPKRLDILLSIFSVSQFLADTLIRNPEFFEWVTTPEILNKRFSREMLETNLTASSGPGLKDREWMDALRRFRRREILRIGTRDFCLGIPVMEITKDLSYLAGAIIQAALNRAFEEIQKDLSPAHKINGAQSKFCIMAVGKLGSMELNYSSDIDLLGLFTDSNQDYIKSANTFAIYSRVMGRIRTMLSHHTKEGYVYRVDYRLRPYGKSGELVFPMHKLLEYYSGEATLIEIQALLKARPVAGNLEIGFLFLKNLRPILLLKRNPAEISMSIEKFRLKAMRNISKRLAAAMDVKNGMGGIRDIEFLVQGMQLIHAPDNPALLVGNTVEALRILKDNKLLDEKISKDLENDYIFLRRVEHFLQIMDDRQTHTIPADDHELTALAKRVLGQKAEAPLLMDRLNECIKRVHGYYREVLFLS
ncbi:MAG: glutamate-ammonia-ligase adenylyltransferase, partial [bacterium]